jgi:hypothetical protein
MDGDGDVELIAVNGGFNTVSILDNDGTGVFGSRPTYAVGSSPQSVKLVDVDADGDLDLVTANLSGAGVSLLRNNGNGVFAARVDYSTGAAPRFISVADIDGDGDLDLVTANSGASANSVSILRNDGAGGFLDRFDFAAGSRPPRALSLGDVDGDGDLDILAASYDDGGVAVLIVERSV